jgi:1-aminocyclopropane-1-carboxylate deaminase/D-cysteine desulfhydrase-like pyridoxal-dependent ACC family enzyme
MTGPAQPSRTATTPQPDDPDRLALFRLYPRLEERLPHIPLGCLPTPVERLTQVETFLGLERLYVKRDDLSAVTYGGNKVRKLEFLLGDALRAGAREVITMGFAGSNHALATALYAQRLGLRCVSLLMPQVNAHYVRRNLLAGHHFQSELRPCSGAAVLILELLKELFKGRMRDGVIPRFIPGGGSCPLGVAGYVNAAFELKEQIHAGVLPEPDLIYVPLGSMGTSVGLMLGLKAAGINSQVMAIRVIEEKLASPGRMLRLFRETATFLHKLDPFFPDARCAEEDLAIRNDCLGDGYARFTWKAVKAANVMREKGGIILNGAYSAKAFSAIVDDAGRKILKDKTVLFWNTYNSRDVSSLSLSVDYHHLPRPLHRYFEEDVQPLDKEGFDR